METCNMDKLIFAWAQEGREGGSGPFNSIFSPVSERHSQYTQHRWNKRSRIPDNWLLFQFQTGKVVGIKQKSNYLGVYSVERPAALFALKWVEENKLGNTLISSDSVSFLKSLRSFNSSRQDSLVKVLQVHSTLIQQGMSITFVKVAAHWGLRGNEGVDRLAEQGLHWDTIDLQVLFSRSQVKVIGLKQ